MAFDEENASEEKTDAVEVAQGPVTGWLQDMPAKLNEVAQTVWEHTRLKDAESPWGDQIDMWQNNEGGVTVRTTDYSEVKTIRLDIPAMEKLVDAWLARHPRPMNVAQVTTHYPNANASASTVPSDFRIETFAYPEKKLDDLPALDLAH